MKTTIDRIKYFIEEHPEYSVVAKKHELNVLIMKKLYPELETIKNQKLVEIFKELVNLDRYVRKAKEELIEEGKIERTEKEEKTIQMLEEEKMLELGYEPNYKPKLF